MLSCLYPHSMLHVDQLGTCQAGEALPARSPSSCWGGSCSEPTAPTQGQGGN